MTDFGRFENLMYACRLNLYWWEDGKMIDLTYAEFISFKDDEVTIKDKDNLYWSWNIDVLEAKLKMLAEEHAEAFTKAFASIKE